MQFQNRNEAGKQLAKKLSKYKKNAIVLAIPRGGVVIGYEISKALKVELNLIITKKIGLPGNEEFAIGSVGPDKKTILDEETVKIYNVKEDFLKKATKEIGKEIERRYKEYTGSYEPPKIKNKTAIITDDGIATGLTIKSAIEYSKSQKAKKIIVAVPVLSKDYVDKFKKMADEFIYLYAPKIFFAVGEFYQEFEQLNDGDVKKYLK